MRFDDLPEKLQTLVVALILFFALSVSGFWFGLLAVVGARVAKGW